MKILKFEGYLLDIMGEEARGDWEKECGLKFHNGQQTEDSTVTLLEVIDESKAIKYMSHPNVEVLTGVEANAYLVKNIDKLRYEVTSESLMSANINQLSSNVADLDLSEMSPEWDEQQELDFLYKKGISGIKKNEVITKKFLEEDLTPEQLLEMISIFPDWNDLIGRTLEVGTKLKYDGNLYRVVQKHIAQLDWIPSDLPALYVRILPENVIPLWVQPTGGHDAYNIGDKVTFEGLVYESLINANTWSPTDYPQGWKAIKGGKQYNEVKSMLGLAQYALFIHS